MRQANGWEGEARERFIRGGAEALSDLELIRLVLAGSGPLDEARLRCWMSRQGGLRGLSISSLCELAQLDGLGLTRATTLLAAIALVRRADAAGLRVGEPIGCSDEVYRYVRPRFAGVLQERFYVLLLDGQGRLQADVRISEGTLTASLVHPREVFRRAIRETAAAMIFVHNHPSGDPTASPEDRQLTDLLVRAGDLLGIPVLDHIVVGAETYTSFADAGWIGGLVPAERVFSALDRS